MDSKRQTGPGTLLDLKFASSASNSCSPKEKPNKIKKLISWFKKNKQDNDSLSSSKVIDLKHSPNGTSCQKRISASDEDYYLDHDINDDQISLEILRQLKDWRKKYRWMMECKKQKNPRYKGEGDVDIAIIHYGTECLHWAQYLETDFSILLYDSKPGCSQVRIKLFNIESLRSQNLSMVTSSQLRESMLQILILSPHFLTFLQSTPSFDLSQVLNQDRVLALVIRCSWYHVKDTSVTVPFLYSLTCIFKIDDASFLVDVRDQSLKILNSNPIFANFVSSSSFSLCPRKVTPSQSKVHIHLQNQINEDEKLLIKIVLQVHSSLISVNHVYQNPFTLSFTVPDQFLGRSKLISVNLYKSDSFIGFRKLKSETTIGFLKEILASATDPLNIMCQALNISSVDGKLDTILAQGVKQWTFPPTPVNIRFQELGSQNPYCGVYPTWLHFAAAFGLEKYAWALLTVPGSESLLYAKNQKGKTPAKLALEEGYTKLAEGLEDYAFDSRKKVQELLSNCDTLPSPRPRRRNHWHNHSYTNLPLESLQEDPYMDMTATSLATSERRSL